MDFDVDGLSDGELAELSKAVAERLQRRKVLAAGAGAAVGGSFLAGQETARADPENTESGAFGDGDEDWNVQDIDANHVASNSVTTNKETLDNTVVRVYPQEGTPTQSYVDVEVTPDGSGADLFPTLQDINDGALSIGKPGAVHLPAGTYNIRGGQSLTWDCGGTLIGAGYLQTHLNCVGATSGPSINVTGNGAMLRGFRLGGQSNVDQGIVVDAAKNVDLKNLYVDTFGGAGIKAKNSAYYLNLESVEVRACNQSGADGYGLGAIPGGGSATPNGLNARNVQVYQTVDGHGVEINQAGGVTWLGGFIERNEGAGMKVKNLFGMDLVGTSFASNNDDSAESRVREQVELSVGLNSQVVGFRGSFKTTPGFTSYSVAVGDGGTLEGSVFNGCAFGDSPSNTDVGVFGVGSKGVEFRNCRYSTSSKFSVRANGLTENGIGTESANAETPTAADWPVGSAVDFTDSGDGSGDGVYRLLPDESWAQIATT
jgi:hypothetical protein